MFASGGSPQERKLTLGVESSDRSRRSARLARRIVQSAGWDAPVGRPAQLARTASRTIELAES
jgi:hypothetical protein